MSNIQKLEHKISRLQLKRGDNPSKSGTSVQKSGPSVPPKPSKISLPQVPQSCNIKVAPIPSYSTVLNNSEIHEKNHIYANSAGSYNAEKNLKFSQMGLPNDNENLPNHAETENYYANQPSRKYSTYDDKNYYSNIGLQVSVSMDRLPAQTQEIVYSNIEPSVPIPVPQMIHSNKDIIYSNIQWKSSKPTNTYCNVSSPGIINDDLPPPPDTSEYVSCIPGSYSCLPDDLPPPPSPVSSSYSELRRATYQTDLPSESYPNDIYGPSSQSSSTYESIYEPINPRPPSQLSSNYSLYSGYGPPQNPEKISPVKEVDVLTDLLVQGMADDDDDIEIFGICSHCGKKVKGEGSGCSAMDKVFHIKCFCCYACNANLQGKPFYSLEGKPYCEEDYLNTLEKCCVCNRPILDRILRATGKPYHPLCFTCVICGKSLDGIPFTVDAMNQVHCIECFHKKFAPRCCVCKLPIMPEAGQDETVRVVALDRSFHTQCYKCEDCGLVLSSNPEGSGCYPLDNHVLCKSCNATRVRVLTSRMTRDL